MKHGRKTLYFRSPFQYPFSSILHPWIRQLCYSLTCSSNRSPYKRTRHLMWVCRVLIPTLGNIGKKKSMKKEDMLAMKNQRSFSYSAYFANFKVLYLLAKASVLCALCWSLWSFRVSLIHSRRGIDSWALFSWLTFVLFLHRLIYTSNKR